MINIKSIVSKVILIVLLTVNVANVQHKVSSDIFDSDFDSIRVSSNAYELTVNDRVGIGMTAQNSFDPTIIGIITRDCEFSSSDNNVAYVQDEPLLGSRHDAHIRAVGAGTALITVTYKNLQATIQVTVKNNRSTIEKIVNFGGTQTVLTPPFRKDITEYNLVVPKNCSVIPKVSIKRKDIYSQIVYVGSGPDIYLYVEADYNPIIEVIEADSILGTTEIKVTAADGTASNTYKVHYMYETSIDPRYMLGNIVFTKNQTELNAAVYISNIDAYSYTNNAALILAKYDATNKLKEIKKCEEKFSYYRGRWIETPSVTLEDGCYYKAFVWEDFNNKNPLSEPAYYYDN